eukprot:2279899-Rhodomonas_salina.1
MHETDLESGGWMEDDALLQKATQPAPDAMSVEDDVESNDGGALSTMKELTKAISEPLRDVTKGPEQRLLRGQIKELDLETDLVPDDEETVKGTKDLRKHY